MSTRPCVSVGLAVYNGAAFVSQAIESVKQQEMHDWEIVVVDDGSEDESSKVVQRFRDPRVRLIQNKSNLGLPQVRNQIVSEARSPLIAWLDQDDRCLPNRLLSQGKFLNTNPDYGAIGTWVRVLTRTGSGITSRVARRPIRKELVAAETIFANPIFFSSSMLRTSVLKNYGLEFRDEYRDVLDYALWSELAEVSQIGNVPAVLCEVLEHSDQTSRQLGRANSMREDAIAVSVTNLQRRWGISIDDDMISALASLKKPEEPVDCSSVVRIFELFAVVLAENRRLEFVPERFLRMSIARQIARVTRAQEFGSLPMSCWLSCLQHLRRTVGVAPSIWLGAALS